jgi:ankyrin repeat protein
MYKQTALMVACERINTANAELLIAKGADVEAKSDYVRTL